MSSPGRHGPRRGTIGTMGTLSELTAVRSTEVA